MPTTRPSRPARLASRAALALTAVALAAAWAGSDLAPDGGGPAYTPAGELLRPADYREWAFVSSGLGMTYGPAKAAAGAPPRFDNVFVTRDAYRAFLRSGTWPERTMFVLEVRAAEADVSINNGGRTQGGLVALEAAVKDRGRFGPDGWGYFSFDGPAGPVGSARPLPTSASCYSCHAEKAALDHTFVQFYPTLLEAARRHGKLRPGDGKPRARAATGAGAPPGPGDESDSARRGPS